LWKILWARRIIFFSFSSTDRSTKNEKSGYRFLWKLLC